jgi:rhombotail lipoprotein
MKIRHPFFRSLSIAVVAVVGLNGCAMFGPSMHRQASSVLQFLYPKDQAHVEQATIPVLALPLKIGIAFVPEETSTRGGVVFNREGATFTEQQKMTLMKDAGESFKQYPFVQSIQLIPSAYLTPAGGFANLDQIRSMFGVDVIVLLSYDQAQFRDEGMLSLTYLTLVGAYVVQGEKNDTQTMIDAVVYDLPSRKLLFRAPGTSKIKGSATPVNLSEELRHDSERGFRDASTNMVANLKNQLASFKEQIKKSPSEFKIEAKTGYTVKEAGSFSWIESALLSVMCLAGFLLPTNSQRIGAR